MSSWEDRLDLAWANYHAGEFEKALEILGGIEGANEVLKLRGLCLFQMGRFQEALKSLQDFALETNAALDWFSVATTAAMAGNPDLAMEAFEKCKTRYEAAESEVSLTLPLLHWYFLQAMVNAGYASLLAKPFAYLVDAFSIAKITDSHYLSTRGLPDWDGFLEILWPILGSLPTAQADAMLEHLRKEVDGPGKSSLKLKRY